MGSDIHLFIEYTEGDNIVALSDGEMNVQRDYDLFAALAGKQTLEKPSIAPRGLPTDISSEIFERYYLFIVKPSDINMYNGFNTVSPKQAKAWVDSGVSHKPPAEYIKHNATSPLGYISNPDFNTPSWLWRDELLSVLEQTHVTPLPTFKLVIELLELIERILEESRARIVFWFDN